LQGPHAESYLLLDCLEKEMNEEHDEMVKSARQIQFLTQLREYSRASGRPARDGVVYVMTRIIEHEGTGKSFQESVDTFIKRIEKRAVEKIKEMDAEMAAQEGAEKERGELTAQEVFNSLPEAMQQAFLAKDMQRLHRILEEMDVDEAKYHMQRCEESGLWVGS